MGRVSFSTLGRSRVQSGRPVPTCLRKVLRVAQTPREPLATTFTDATASNKKKIICRYSVFRWGFIRGIILGFNRGVRLEGHPSHPAEPLVTEVVGGSDGIPDSLVHKPRDTSGRAAWSASFPLHTNRFTYTSHLRHRPTSSFLIYSLSSLPLSLGLASPFSLRSRQRVADLRRHKTTATGMTVRTVFYSSASRRHASARKSLEKCGVFSIARTASQSHNCIVTGGTGNHTEYHARRELCR
jgi:hypothetical protein